MSQSTTYEKEDKRLVKCNDPVRYVRNQVRNNIQQHKLWQGTHLLFDSHRNGHNFDKVNTLRDVQHRLVDVFEVELKSKIDEM